ncbi:MAG: GNAT family N-acetyltransferase [Candidatus Lokiarchaeota archaeon]
MTFRIIDINETNIKKYGLLCKKSQKKQTGYQNKVKWIKDRFKEGLKYKLLLVREGEKETSRGFIEYIPGKYNWRGIEANNWMVIHCIWVIGKHKNKGYASNLLKECINDAKEAKMYGVVGMTAEKGGWLPKSNIFIKNSFKEIDEFSTNYKLYAIVFDKKLPLPKFYSFPKVKLKKYDKGITILYTHQCPYLPDLINDIEELSVKNNVSFQKILLNDTKEIQQYAIHPYGTFNIIGFGKIIPYKPGIKKEVIKLLETKNL